MKNKYDLLFEYFNKQKEILSLLEESNNIVSELFNCNNKEEHIEEDVKLSNYDHAIKKELIREIIRDSLKPSELVNIDKVEDDKWYTFRYHDSRGRRKYIQFDKINYVFNDYNLKDNIVRPKIVTKTGYRAGCNVIFRTRQKAIEFFVKFMSSDIRRNIDEYEMDAWKIIEVPERVLDSQQFSRHWDTDYGWFTV